MPNDAVRHAVSITPIETLVSEEASDEVRIIWPGTGGPIGGNGEYTIGDVESSTGYSKSGSVITKIICSTNTTSGNVLHASSSECTGLFIRNSGFLCNSTAQSSTITTTPITSGCCVTVTVNSKIIASLGSGEAIFFPNNGGHANDLKPSEFTVKASVAENVGVEYLVLGQ